MKVPAHVFIDDLDREVEGCGGCRREGRDILVAQDCAAALDAFDRLFIALVARTRTILIM